MIHFMQQAGLNSDGTTAVDTADTVSTLDGGDV